MRRPFALLQGVLWVLFLVWAKGITEDDVLIVITVDGTMAGFEKESGSLLWKRQMESPVVTTTTTSQSYSKEWNTAAVPALDGTIYLTHRNNAMTTHIRDLTQRSPFFEQNGRIYNADRSSSVIVIDKRDGKILKDQGYTNNQKMQDPNLVWLGKIDYSVSIFEAKSMVLDAAFSVTEFQGMTQMVDTTILAQNPSWLGADSRETFIPDTQSQSILGTPNGYIGYRTDSVKWVTQVPFDTPIAFALDSTTGTALPIDLVPDPVLMESSAEYISAEMERQLEITNYQNEQPVVGLLPSGQLYALPLGRWDREPALALGNHKASISASTQSSLESPAHIAARRSTFNTPKLGKRPSKHLLAGRVHPLQLPPADETAIVPFYHPDYGFVPPLSYQIPEYTSTRKLLRLFSSWLPAAFAFFFVVSFELGRRKKDRERNEKDFDGKEESDDTGLIQIEDEILGYGGHGTVVYKGKLEGRQVAVKRMLKTYHASADREISLLIESDGHSNVVRYFLKEVRGDFVYLALELCDLSLDSLISHLQSTVVPSKPLIATRSTLLQIASGIRHLHGLRIVHRDLKPANILLADSRTREEKDRNEKAIDIFFSGGYVAKISDMGLGKQLLGQSSFGASTLDQSLRGQMSDGNHSFVGNGPGSVGWQAPEVMVQRLASDISVRSEGSAGVNDSSQDCSPLDVPSLRTSRSVDIFSLGCVFYSLLVPGGHPFGEWFEREANIMHNRPNIDQLAAISYEAYRLISSMINRNPSSRPSASEVCEHPFFWNLKHRLDFLCSLSDRLESEDMREDGTPTEWKRERLFIERNASKIIGTSWDLILDPDLLSNVQKFRGYDVASIRDLLRLIRNKSHHFDELSESLKIKMNGNTEGLLEYFEERFPMLLMHCYIFCQEFIPSDDSFAQKYCITSLRGAQEAMRNTPVIHEDRPTEPLSSNDEEKKDLTADEVDGDTGSSALQPSSRPEDETNAVESLVPLIDEQMIVWQGSAASRELGGRGWNRSDDEWARCLDKTTRKPDTVLVRCATDPKFRTRLCNHWDASLGTLCPILKKNKCVFAHGPVELRVKEGKKKRWGKLVDKNGDNKNPRHSGGEDTYGAARSIESERRQEGKWKVDNKRNGKAATNVPKAESLAES